MNMCFAKELNKKGLKEMQADTAKTMSTCAKAIRALIKPNEINPRSQNVAATSSIDLPTSFTPSSGKVFMLFSPRIPGSGGERPRLKTRPRVSCGSSSGFQRCLRPQGGSSVETSVSQCEGGRTGAAPELLSASDFCLRPPMVFA
ncbi:unnamed protein product [Gulo gulo]|uniref:60S ribosomal protein L29 n=1 Tax=Gulo gulo TaxID=48420 RepID=A0A9X9LJY8_GULGU|nr:unnamed protein product [Gulo gulo]